MCAAVMACESCIRYCNHDKFKVWGNMCERAAKMGIFFNKLSASDSNTSAEHLFALYFSEYVAMHCLASLIMMSKQNRRLDVNDTLCMDNIIGQVICPGG